MTRTGCKVVLVFLKTILSFMVGLLLLAAGGLLATASGCAASEGYRVSQQMMQERKYDQAVAELRKLVFENPENSQYQLLLGEAESKGADQHVSRAKKLRTEHRPRDAREELRIALDQVPAHPEAVVMIGQVAQEIEKATALAERAQAALTQFAYREAVQLADAALAIDQTLKATQQVRDKALASAVQVHRDLANEAMGVRRWDTCLAEAVKIRELDRDDPFAAAIEQQVANRQRALVLLESAQTPMRDQDYMTAIKPLREAASLWPENADISSQRDHATRVAVKQFADQAERKLKAEQFAEAIETLDQALLISPNDSVLIQRRQDAATSWSAHLLDQYERRVLAGEWEQAWRQAIQAAVLCPAVRDRVGLDLVRAEDKIREEIAYNMSLLPLPSATVPVEGIKTICYALTETIGKIKPDHVQLLERANLSEILAEHDLSLANISESAKLTELGQKLPGIDVFLFVDVSAQESQDRQPLKPGTSKYLAGKENVQNPDYANADKDLKQKKKALDQARSRALLNEMMWDAAGRKDLRSEQSFLHKAVTGYYGLNAQRAAEDYHVALMKLHDTPQRIERDRWQQHQYPVYRVERQVSVKVRLRLIEVATGRILWSDNESVGKALDADTLIEPDTAHNVPSKSVALKSAASLKAEAVERVIPALHTKARSLLSCRSATYLQDAQENTGEIAVDNYIRFLFDCGPDPEPRDITLALDKVFRSYVAGTALDECKRLASERLKISTKVSATKPCGRSVTTALVPIVKPNTPTPVLTATQPADYVAPSVDKPRRPGRMLPTLVRRARETVRQPQAPAGESKTPLPIASVGQAPAVKASVARVIEAAVSRDDDRYPKQLQLSDGITVKVDDTDEDPLDADLEIRVGSRRQKYKNLRVGAKIPVRGLTGGRYDIILLAIEDRNETVRFALDRIQP